MKAPTPLPSRVCPDCGCTFAPAHHRALFCSAEHQRAFHHRNAVRGQALLPFAQVSRAGKSGFNDERRYALRCYNQLVDRWAAEDRAAGRRPDLIVSRKMAALWAPCDLGRSAEPAA